MSNANTLKVGDELAFHFRAGSGCSRWEIRKIDKITPTGRIKIGGFELNPDLTVRGERGWNSPYCAEPVTDVIRKAVKRQNNISLLSQTKFGSLSDDQLNRIVAIRMEDPAE